MKRVALIALSILCLGFCLYRLTESPPFWYDEGWYVQTSTNLATTGIDGIQLQPGLIQHVPFLTVGYPLIYPLALWLKIFGLGVASARSLMVLFILGLCAASFFMIKRLYGTWPAIGALALLVTFPPLYGNGKSVLGEVPGMFYLLLFMLFFNIARNVPAKRAMWIIFAGLAAGLSIATKPMFLVLLPALLVGIGVEWRRGHIALKDIGIGVACTIVPIIVWFFIQFGGGHLAGLLSFYANPYHETSLIHVLLANLRNIFTDLSTLYTMLILGVWSVALFLRLRSKDDAHKASGEEIVAYVFSMLVFLAFLRIGYVYRYIFPAQVLALAFLWPSVDRIISKAAEMSRRPKAMRTIGISLTVIIGLLGLYQLMFSSWVADSYSSHKSAFWQDYFSQVPASTSVFFYDTPEVIPFIHGRNYYQSLLTPAGNPTGPEELAVIGAGGADLVIAVTDKYQPLKDSLFSKYLVAEEAYKYSILKLKR